MKNKDIALVLIAIAAIAAAAVITFMNAGGDGPPEGLGQPTHFVCNEDECGAEFTLTVGELLAIRDANDDYVPCPECAKLTTSIASKCHNCGRHVRGQDHDLPPEFCTYCGVRLGVNVEHTHADGTTHEHEAADSDHEHEGDASP